MRWIEVIKIVALSLTFDATHLLITPKCSCGCGLQRDGK